MCTPERPQNTWTWLTLCQHPWFRSQHCTVPSTPYLPSSAPCSVRLVRSSSLADRHTLKSRGPTSTARRYSLVPSARLGLFEAGRYSRPEALVYRPKAALTIRLSNIQHLQHATCNMQHATCNMQHVTCNTQHATCPASTSNIYYQRHNHNGSGHWSKATVVFAYPTLHLHPTPARTPRAGRWRGVEE